MGCCLLHHDRLANILSMSAETGVLPMGSSYEKTNVIRGQGSLASHDDILRRCLIWCGILGLGAPVSFACSADLRVSGWRTRQSWSPCTLGGSASWSGKRSAVDAGLSYPSRMSPTGQRKDNKAPKKNHLSNYLLLTTVYYFDPIGFNSGANW